MKALTLPSLRQAGLLAIAALAGGVLVTGCAGSSRDATRTATVTVSGATRTPTVAKLTAPSTPPARPGDSALAFARCMRANGVPNFPDPIPGRGLLFSTAGINPAAPAVRAAQAKCQTLLRDGGPPRPGETTHPSAQTLAKLLRIARCMRGHGISQFPDPRTSVPSNLAGIQDVTDFDGVILLYPVTFNLQAPAYRRALAACGAPPLGLPH